LFPTPFGNGTFTKVDPDDLCQLGLGERPKAGLGKPRTRPDGVSGGETANCVGVFVGP
jgi:hypothetical protein